MTTKAVITTLYKLPLVCDNPIQTLNRFFKLLMELSQPHLYSWWILTPTIVRFTSNGFWVSYPQDDFLFTILDGMAEPKIIKILGTSHQPTKTKIIFKKYYV
jgi:hypothetical protein